MTKQEVNKLLALMKANYSYAFKTMSQQDKYLLLNTWTFTLQDLNADVVMIAVMQLISESKWLPTVAEIRKKCQSLYYSASYAPRDPFDNLSDEEREKYGIRPCSQQEIEEKERREATRKYIMDATCHLRGDGEPTLSLDSILSNPNFAALGAGNSSLAMLGEVKYELPDGSVEGEDEQGYPDRQSHR